MLSKERITREITSIKATIEKLKELDKEIEINELVLKAFERELLKVNRNF